MKDDPVDQAKQQVSEAMKQRRGEPSKDADDAARQIAALRAALIYDVETIRERIPQPSEIADRAREQVKGGGVLAAGGTAIAALILYLLRRRSRREAEERQLREQALAVIVARELNRLDLFPSEQRKRPWAIIAAAIGMLAGAASAVVLLRRKPDVP